MTICSQPHNGSGFAIPIPHRRSPDCYDFQERYSVKSSGPNLYSRVGKRRASRVEYALKGLETASGPAATIYESSQVELSVVVCGGPRGSADFAAFSALPRTAGPIHWPVAQESWRPRFCVTAAWTPAAIDDAAKTDGRSEFLFLLCCVGESSCTAIYRLRRREQFFRLTRRTVKTHQCRAVIFSLTHQTVKNRTGLPDWHGNCGRRKPLRRLNISLVRVNGSATDTQALPPNLAPFSSSRFCAAVTAIASSIISCADPKRLGGADTGSLSLLFLPLSSFVSSSFPSNESLSENECLIVVEFSDGKPPSGWGARASASIRQRQMISASTAVVGACPIQVGGQDHQRARLSVRRRVA